MVKAWQSDNTNHQTTNAKTKTKTQEKENLPSSVAQNNIRPGYLSNDIFISRSGQVKINNLDSCQTLSCCDFIVF